MTDLAPHRVQPGTRSDGRGPAAVFLDRDGVLNDVPGDGSGAASPRSISEVHLVPGAADAVERLHHAGFILVVVTNQPDVARGWLSAEDAIAITYAVVAPLGVDDAYVCTHDGPDGCRCRKPLPGLLTTAAADWGISLPTSWLVGDRWVDVAAGHAAGVRTILLRRPYSDDPSGGATRPSDSDPDVEVASLEEAVTMIIGSPA
jgi:D-glycero-D-manno-heptose 1,7-bisphosphate phosphatase